VAVSERQKDGVAHYGVSLMDACVVSFSPGIYRDGALTLSNVAAYWAAPSQEGQSLKPEEFVTWAKRILTLCRKMTPVIMGTYRATPEVERQVKSNTLKVAAY
jgi:hypothetical protein